MPFPKTYRTNAGWGLSIGAILALFSNLRNEQRAVIALTVLGALGCLWSAWEHEWIRGNRKSIPRVMLIVGLFLLIAWLVWPPPNTVERKIDQLLESLAYSPEKLHEKYPRGYFIFELDYQNDKNKMHILKTRAGDFELDWTNVGFVSNDAERAAVRLPDMEERKSHVVIRNAVIGGNKKVGEVWFGHEVNGLGIVGEIIAIRGSGMTFLVGFTNAPVGPVGR